MKILLKKEVEGEFEPVEIEEGITLEDLYKKYKSEIKYRVLVAKINNVPTELAKKIEKECKVEFLDMRSQMGNMVYQSSLSFIYIKAVTDVLDGAIVHIENSLNKGLYTEIKGVPSLKQEDIEKIDARMREIVALDIPIKKRKADREEAKKIMEKECMIDKIRLIDQMSDLEWLSFYSLDGYEDFYYNYMVPSAGYIKEFEIRKYRRGVLLRFPYQTDPSKIPQYENQKALYSAFGDATRYNRLFEIYSVADLNEKLRNGEAREIIQLAEALHEKKIVEIANQICEEDKRIILIAGPSSSGKTTFARRLCVQLTANGRKPLYMGTDDYFLERKDNLPNEKGEIDYEGIKAVDLNLFNSHMNKLLDGEVVDIPEYDFIKGEKVYGKRITSIKPLQPIVIEGIHALNSIMTEEIDEFEKFKIYISPLTQLNIDRHNRIPTTDARMLRRLVRDYISRGYGADATIRNWPKVRRGEDKNIFPYNDEADVFFNSNHIYEISVLKKYAEPILSEIDSSSSEYGEAQRLLKFLRYFQVLEHDELISNTSIIKEFIGGSVFV